MQGQGGAWTKGGVTGRAGTRDVRGAGEGKACGAWRRWGRGPRRGEVETGMAGAGRARREDGATSAAEGGAWSGVGGGGGGAAKAVSADPQNPATRLCSALRAGAASPIPGGNPGQPGLPSSSRAPARPLSAKVANALRG